MSIVWMKLVQRIGGTDVRSLVARTVSIALLVLLIVTIGRTYFGHSSSPYGVCYGTSGRSIPCALAARGK